MAQVQEITPYHVDLDLSNPIFAYLTPDETYSIFCDAKNIAQFEFYKGDKFLFAMLLESLGDNLHVRELAGKFPPYRNYIQKFCCVVAKVMNKQRITAVTQHEVLKKIYLSFGWKKDSKVDEYFYEVA